MLFLQSAHPGLRVSVFFFLVTVISVFLGILIGTMIQKAKMGAIIKASNKNAIKRSRAVLGGQFYEQLSPFFPNFPCNPADAKFLGQPIDFIAFKGSAEGKPISEVLLIEVKTGKSQLSEREKQIKDAVEKGRIRYVEYRIQESRNMTGRKTPVRMQQKNPAPEKN